MKDKQIEQQRYNKFSKNILSIIVNDKALLQVLGADNFPIYLRPPYLHYHDLIHKNTIGIKKQLDLCCGNGMHSFTGAKNGATVIALDYAEQSIALCKKRSKALNLYVDFRTSDVQTLSEYVDNEFDVVSCAGSLSYIDHDLYFSEVYRVLKRGGVFICVDSFNHNPIYSFNRFIHFLRGERSYSTLKRMPNMDTINLLNQIFKNVEVSYFGIFAFIAPLLKPMMPPETIAQIINKLDILFPFLRRYSFKIVIAASK
jgi:ubiquinone/menaquinone biosynthesis C-methylase UbiE